MSLLLERPAPADELASIVDEVTRREFAAGAALAALLVGCGGASGNRSSGAGGTDGSFPLTMDGVFGPTRIDRRPERVAAVGFLRDGDDALALGVTPVAMATSGNFSEGLAPWTRTALGPATPSILEATDGLPFEQIAAARPDLILATDDRTLEDHHDRLAAIAPTLAYSIGAEAEPWRLRAERIGRALGRSQLAAETIRRIEQLIQSTRRQHPEFEDKTIVTGPVVGGKVYVVNRENDAAAALQQELGFRLSAKVTALPESFPGRAEISPEQLSLLEADVIMLIHVTPDDRKTVESNELFQRLDAVRRGSYISMDPSVGIAGGYPSLLSIPYSLDGIVPLLAKALTA